MSKRAEQYALMKISSRRWVVVQRINTDPRESEEPMMYEAATIPLKFPEARASFRELAGFDAPTRRTANWVE